MRQLGILMALLGIASCVVYFMNMEMKLLMWINNWGEGVAWGIRGGLIVVGALLAKMGAPKDKKK
ncbi:MAG: hypothetical protein H6838_16850 [Planctomycetes bacterium]|nr:hypothetical protein [Planctomycetota bacterium]